MRIDNDEFVQILIEATTIIQKRISDAFIGGTLEAELHKLGLSDLIPVPSINTKFETLPTGQIIVFGDSDVKAEHIYGVVKSMSINKDRVDLRINYEDLANFNYASLRYNLEYSLILVGPMPHSGKGMGKNASVISMFENEESYPPVIRLMDSNGLKITKTSLRNALQEAMESGYIE